MTDAGYRIYDDHTLARLAFIDRAKQLGCSLEEITDPVGIWDGERCGPVRRRFHELVTTKIVDAQRQISELSAFTAQLPNSAAAPSSRSRSPSTDAASPSRCAPRMERRHRRFAVRAPGMTDPSLRGDGFGVLGIGAAACIACCAGPLLAVLGGLSVAGMVGSVFMGAAGLFIAIAATAAFVVVRRRARGCASDAGPAPVDLSRRPS